jgi:dimethylhistidine N-methyltransferase
VTIALAEPSLQTIVPELIETDAAVAAEVRRGLSSNPKTLSPWLFYDEAGSRLFEEITALPEYYLTRTERELFRAHAEEIFVELGEGVAGGLTIAELGAGTAAKTGILLEALTRFQEGVLYQPIDISPTALEEAREAIERSLPEVMVRPRLANYITEPFSIEREVGRGVLALYIGSSIGNFSPEEARGILGKLREQLEPGDALLLGTDLAPSATKSVARLLAAYDDAAGVTAAFNRNVLVRLNRELDADFDLKRFVHRARWNAAESRIEMHLESTRAQTVRIPANCAGEALAIRFARGETIHTENSCKFTAEGIARLLGDSGFATGRTFVDPEGLFAVTLARSV